MVLLQVFQADLQVQLTSPSDDVLPRLLNDALKEAMLIENQTQRTTWKTQGIGGWRMAGSKHPL